VIEYILSRQKVPDAATGFCVCNLPTHVRVRFEVDRWMMKNKIYIATKNSRVRGATFSWQLDEAGKLTATLDQDDLWPSALLVVRYSQNLIVGSDELASDDETTEAG